MSLNELASEGERLCKAGDCAAGIAFFEDALQKYEEIKRDHRSDEEEIKLMQTLSIIYNQMGNAYFYLQDYHKALEYHKKDLELSEQFGDESGKAKACGNIGNTLQLLGDYDEAILYSQRNLDISQRSNDLTGEARALYNLGNIYQSKGKHMGRITYSDRDPNNGEFSKEIKEVLLKAVLYYRKTLQLVQSKDRAAEGRTYGNLGNTYYLLGDFDSAIECHVNRLRIAKEHGDRAAERRAYSNLGNAHIFQGKFNEATDYYIKAMNVARMLGDKAIEAQSYYSLGNAYILLQDYSVAIDFHLRHLQIAQLLEDRIGESRAFWSLGNAYAALGDLENAIIYANKHLQIARLIGDSTSELTAKMNLYDFQNLLSSSNVRDGESALFTPMSAKYGGKNQNHVNSNCEMNPMRKSISIDSFYTNTAMDRQPISKANANSINNTNKIPTTPVHNGKGSVSHFEKLEDKINHHSYSLSNNDITKLHAKSNGSHHHHHHQHNHNKSKNESAMNTTCGEEAPSFLETLTRVQSNRLDDQRCSLKRPTLTNRTNQLANATAAAAAAVKDSTTLIKNELMKGENYAKNDSESSIPNDDFFNLIMKCQKTRLEDQRTSLSMPKQNSGSLASSKNNAKNTTNVRSTNSLNLESSLSSTSSLSNAPSLEPVSASVSTSSSGSKLNSVNTINKSTTASTASITITSTTTTNKPAKQQQAVTVPPDDEFFSLIQKIQSRRLDEQRSVIKPHHGLMTR